MKPAGSRRSIGAGLFFILFGLPFLLAGLAVLTSPLWGPLRSEDGNPSSLFFTIPFSLIFCGTGSAFIYAGLVGLGVLTPRVLAEREATEHAHPDEPWLWKKEWAEGRIPSMTQTAMRMGWVIALFWNLISTPILFAVPDELEKGNTPILIGLIFPLVGLGLLVNAIRLTMIWNRFGKVIFEMASVPARPGSSLTGVILVPEDMIPEGGFRIALKCIRRIVRGSGKNRTTEERILWQEDRIVSRDLLPADLLRTAIPVRFDIPPDAAQTDESNPSDTLMWRLESTADIPGIDFMANFEIPVFRGDAKSRTLSVSSKDIEREGRGVVASDVEKITVAEISNDLDGSTLIRFPRLRAPAMAIGMLVMLGMFTVIPGVIAYNSVSWPVDFDLSSLSLIVIVPIGAIILLIDLLLLYLFLDGLLGWCEIRVTPGRISIRKGMIGNGMEKVISVADLRSIVIVDAGHAGSTRYFQIKIQPKAGKELKGPDGIAGRIQAEAIVKLIKRTAKIEN